MRRNKDRFASIRLTDWGIALGGEHFNVDIDHEGEFVEVEQVMTEQYAGRLNKKDGTRSNRPGDSTLRFESRESAIEAGVEKARELWPSINAVFVGDAANPDYVPWCIDSNLQRKMNVLHEKMQELYKISYDPWSVNNEGVDAIYFEWDKLMKQLDVDF